MHRFLFLASVSSVALLLGACGDQNKEEAAAQESDTEEVVDISDEEETTSNDMVGGETSGETAAENPGEAASDDATVEMPGAENRPVTSSDGQDAGGVESREESDDTLGLREVQNKNLVGQEKALDPMADLNAQGPNTKDQEDLSLAPLDDGEDQETPVSKKDDMDPKDSSVEQV